MFNISVNKKTLGIWWSSMYLDERKLELLIDNLLEQQPLLYERLNLNHKNCKIRIMENAKYILDFVQNKYNDDHPFRDIGFIDKPVLYQIAYSKLICEDYLENRNIINNYLDKKLISNIEGKFDIDLFNRNMNELMLLIYILMGIYIKSDLHTKIVRIDYEEIEPNSKEFEYSFICNDEYRINVEVKTLDCDPFLRDKDVMRGIDIYKKNIYIKKFFHGVDAEEELNSILDGVKEYTELKSNYRQVNSNIKKIRKKFEQKTEQDVNIGVLVINYGTSREEFFSYFLHEERGIVRRKDVGNIDNLNLFSNTHQSSFLLDEIYETQHIFAVNLNLDNYKEEIFRKLRLDNYIIKNGLIEDEYSSYQYNSVGVYTSEIIDGCFTILPDFVDVEERKKHFDEMNKNNENIFNYDIKVRKSDGKVVGR